MTYAPIVAVFSTTRGCTSRVRSGAVCALALLVLIQCMATSVQAQAWTAIRGVTIETGGKAGTIAGGTILIRNGRIESVGSDVEVPITARIIDLPGCTVLPGFIDPYYAVTVGADSQPDSGREITIGGRTIRIPGSPAATPTAFTRIVDGFDPRGTRWLPATRQGITTAQLVTAGFGESVIANIVPENDASLGVSREVLFSKHPGQLFFALANQTASLQALRSGLIVKEKEGSTENRPAPSPEAIAAMRGRTGRGTRPSGGPDAAATSAAATPPKPIENQPKSPAEILWEKVRNGEQPLFVNANSAAAVLYLMQVLQEAPKARVTLVAEGTNLYRAMDSLDPQRVSVILPPRIDLVPNSRDRMNVARMLTEKKFKVAFSPSLNSADFAASQASPFFAVAMLVRAGMPREKAIEALTSVPAAMLGLEKEMGSIEPGKLANLVVFDADPCSATADIVQVLVEGETKYGR